MKHCLIVAAALLTATPAIAQQACGPRAEIVQVLTGKYREQIIGQGIVNDGAAIEIYASDKGTFTVLAAFGRGLACIVAAGKNFNAIKGKWGEAL